MAPEVLIWAEVKAFEAIRPKSRARTGNPQASATGIMTDLMVIQSEFVQDLWHNGA